MKKNFFISKKNGFTLIELLGVIILLGVLALIVYPMVDGVIKNSKEKSLIQTKENILEAAYNYSIENNLGYNTIEKKLEISKLQDKGFIKKGDIKDPTTGEDLVGCIVYKWDDVNSQYNFKFSEECKLEEIEPTLAIKNKNGVFKNGWAKKDFYVLIENNIEDYKYCIASEECEPTTPSISGSVYISNEGNNVVCAISTNSIGSTGIICEEYKLDKTNPMLSGLSDITVNVGENINLLNGVNATDSLSGIDGQINISPNTIDTSKLGTTKVTYNVSDKAGNTYSVIRNIVVDANAPTIVFAPLSNPINSNGWAKSDFYVKATITDNSGSGLKSGKSCSSNGSECTPTTSFTGNTKDFLVSSEGTNRLCVEVTDNNNKITKLCSDIYNLDKTAPTAGTATFTGAQGSNGWYISGTVNVNVTNGSDSLSGHSNTSSNITVIAEETTGRTVTITTTDRAGNSSSRNYTIKVDRNAPTLTERTGSFEITKGQNVATTSYFNSPVYSISGGSLSCTPTNTSGLNAGNQTVSCTATGGNGLSTTASKTITVKAVSSPPSITFGTNGGNNLEYAHTKITVNDTGGGINTSSLQYAWSTQNVTAPSSGWLTFVNNTYIGRDDFGLYYLWVRASDNTGNTTTTKSNFFFVAPTDTFDDRQQNRPFNYYNSDFTIRNEQGEGYTGDDFAYYSQHSNNFNVFFDVDIPTDGRNYYLTFYKRYTCDNSWATVESYLYVNGEYLGLLSGYNSNGWQYQEGKLRNGNNKIRLDLGVDDNDPNGYCMTVIDEIRIINK